MQGDILITFNYRLGRLGHFAFPALSEEYPKEPKGSYPYMDQIAALEWIRDNISSFGGDPDNVTIFGESAGGVSVHSLLTIPKAKGLFHKAISESGGCRAGTLYRQIMGSRRNTGPDLSFLLRSGLRAGAFTIRCSTTQQYGPYCHQHKFTTGQCDLASSGFG
ncbi:MAG: carboxylesterase family protein [Bacteroidales bacterium]